MKQVITQAVAAIPIFLLHGIVFYVVLCVYLIVSVNVVTNTSKTRALESRMNNVVIPAIGTAQAQAQTATSNAATAQSTANSASSSASSAQSTANSAQSTANSAQSTANNAQPQGAYWSGTFECDAVHSAGAIEADGGFSGSNFSGSYAGGQSGVTTSDGTLASTASAVNGCISRLDSSGLI